mgnify:CR=1 FL=1
MHTRRLTTLILGMWLAGALWMMALAIGNFQGVDRLLESPVAEANRYVKALGEDSARTLLRHQAAELNRGYFGGWHLAQMALAVALVVTLMQGTNGNRLYLGAAGLMFLIVIVQHLLLTPYINTLGKVLDFIPREAPSPERIAFGRLHNAYTLMEVIKIAGAVFLSARLLTYSGASRRRGHSRKDVDAVDDSDHSGVNRS